MILLAATLTRGDLLHAAVPAGPEPMLQGYDPVRSRLVAVDLTQLDTLARSGGGSIEINFFPDAVIQVEFRQVLRRSPSSYTLLGELPGTPLTSAVLAVEGTVAVGTVRLPGQAIYTIDSLPGGWQVACELDPKESPACEAAALPGDPHDSAFGDPHHGAPASPPPPLRLGDADLTIIDVLVLYTPAAEDSAGGEDAILALIHRATDEMNFALERSLVPVRVRLVDIMGIEYTEDPLGVSWDLDCLAFGPYWCNGDLADANSIVLRNSVGADLVSLITHGGWVSMATTLSSSDPMESEWSAWSVIQRAHLQRDVFAHELGHNLGCGHDRDHGGSRLFDYSYGHWFDSSPGGFKRTIMAVTGSSVLTYSNPDLSWDSHPLGVPIDQPDSAHNALTITQSAPFVAGYRETIIHPCIGDIDGNECVDQPDLGLLLASYGIPLGSPAFNPAADLDGDGDIDSIDLGILLDRYGSVCD
jgi:peptidyl-Asp metalloendopeptidase